jgi:hypothetical protein
MKRTLIATAVSATFLLPALAAQEPVVIQDPLHLAAAEAPRAQADAWQRWADEFSHELRASMGTMFAPRMSSTRVVKGAPYSAEMVTETTQSLADGNAISRRTMALVYRDSEGRTRQETGAEGKAARVFINDPVEGRHLTLAPASKSAVAVSRATVTRSGKERQVIRVNGTEVRIEDGKVFLDGQETAPGAVELTSKLGKKVVVDNGRVVIDGKEYGPGPRNVIVHRVDAPDGTQREEVRVHVMRSGDALAPLPPMPPVPPRPPGAVGVAPPAPPMPPMPGVHTMRFESTAGLGKGITTQLGTKDFDGVKAEGKSTVWTIPAGQIGNRNPIHITSETWHSPELQVTVHSRYNDPRTGETVYRLANIRRGEPAPELFKVPEDYKLKSRGRG